MYFNFFNVQNNISRYNVLNEAQEQNQITKFINQISERIKKMEEILVVDRFDGNYAICEKRESGEIINIKKQDLPENISEGTVLRCINGKYTIDIDLQAEIEDRIRNKMNKLWEN